MNANQLRHKDIERSFETNHHELQRFWTIAQPCKALAATDPQAEVEPRQRHSLRDKSGRKLKIAGTCGTMEQPRKHWRFLFRIFILFRNRAAGVESSDPFSLLPTAFRFSARSARPLTSLETLVITASGCERKSGISARIGTQLVCFQRFCHSLEGGRMATVTAPQVRTQLRCDLVSAFAASAALSE
jgi:hypothetical protein